MKDVAIRDFMDLPRGMQEAVFSKMGYTMKMIRESLDGAVIFYLDQHGQMRRWPITQSNKKVINILWRAM